MKVACIGGGPACLFTAITLKVRRPDTEIVVYERNRFGDTFGFGVVFSDETLSNIAHNDQPSIDEVESRFRYWSDLEIRVRGETFVSDGHGFAALARVELLDILGRRASELGIDVRYQTEVTADEVRDADLIVAGDGANSAVRTQFADSFKPTINWGQSQYCWSGTETPLERFTFLFNELDEGWVAAHAYPFDATRSTFIIEVTDPTFERLGLVPAQGLQPGESDPAVLDFGNRVFADELDGHELLANNTRWVRFPQIHCENWRHENIVLLGDAVHTAHFSIGSGTKLALEDAIQLTDSLVEFDNIDDALAHYETERRPVTESLQRSAMVSERWFEEFDHYLDRDNGEFVMSCLTRSQRVTYDNLTVRDPDFGAAALASYRDRLPATDRHPVATAPPIFNPLTVAGVTIPNRIGVPAIEQYAAVDGVVGDWHLVHYGSRAVGGAGLLIAEGTYVSEGSRRTTGCPGLWNDDQVAAWRRVTDFVHAESEAVIGVQLSHAGRRAGSPLPTEPGAGWADGDWDRLAPSPLPYGADAPVPTEFSPDRADEVVAAFVAAAERAVSAGFDLVELQLGHGHLLSSFLSPITNQRSDEFGGDLAGRAALALRVVAAVRAALDAAVPVVVRISASDWLDGGFDFDDAVELSKLLRAGGADAIDVSAGELDPAEAPPYGRAYLAAISDRIRHVADVATFVVGQVSSVEDANTILIAGRADLCLIGRPHLVDPYWTLNASIDTAFEGHEWPVRYDAGRTARRREQTAR